MPPPPPPPPPPGFGGGPGYGAPPAGYGAPPGGYGAPPGGYGAPPGTYPPPPGTYPPPGYGGAGGGGPVPYGLASFGQRAGGYLIDFVIIMAILFVGFMVLGLTIPSDTYDPDPDPSGLGILFLLLSWAGALAYPIVLEGRPEGQTLGKKAVGIRVVRRANGAPLGYGLSAGRTLFRAFIEPMAFGLGLLWAAWDPEIQTFHDKVAGTLVVRSSVYPPPARSAGPPGYQQPAPPPNPYQTG